jgi:hypothetical protein
MLYHVLKKIIFIEFYKKQENPSFFRKFQNFFICSTYSINGIKLYDTEYNLFLRKFVFLTN